MLFACVEGCSSNEAFLKERVFQSHGSTATVKSGGGLLDDLQEVRAITDIVNTLPA
jgi:hypothetical protein